MATILDLVLPMRCLVCRLPGEQLCSGCSDLLPRIGPPLCARCGAPTAWPVVRCKECSGRRLGFAQARAAVVYDDRVRSITIAWKERGLRRLATLAAGILTSLLARPRAGALTYVPPDGDRSVRRGHHPAERLALALGAAWELPVEPLLGRTRRVQQQRGLRLAERRRNVRGAFEPLGRSPPTLVLVDDVYTSGATVAAAATALRRAGARRVEVVTFARAVR